MDADLLPKVRERFFSKLMYIEDHVLWMGSFNCWGTAVFGYNKSSTITPWVLYEWYLTGERPPKARKSSTCTYANCINPAHMGKAKWGNQVTRDEVSEAAQDEQVLENIKKENRDFMKMYNLINRPDKFYVNEIKTPEPPPGFRAAQQAVNSTRQRGKFTGARTVKIVGDKFLEPDLVENGHRGRGRGSYGRTRDPQMIAGHTSTGNLYSAREFIRR